MEKLWTVLFSRLRTLHYSKRKHQNKKQTMKIQLDGSEASMIPLLVSRASSIIKKGNAKPVSIQEFSVGRGIADIYIVSKNAEALRNRKLSNVPAITDKFQNEILRLLWDNNGSPIEELSALAASKRIRGINLNIQKLLELEALILSEDRVFVQESVTTNVIDYSVAIEAKVSDWKKGLKQALRYKHFADRSYLALYESHITTAKNNIHVFKALNIGLIGVSNENVTIYYEPSENLKDPFKLHLASERVYSLVDNTQDSFMARNNFSAYSTSTRLANFSS